MIDNKGSEIFAVLSDPTTKLYLYFLDSVLPILVDLNITFQSTKPQINELYNKMEVAFKTLLEFYINPNYLKSNNICKIQYRSPIHFLHPEKVYLGGNCTIALEKNIISKQAENQFRSNCLNFYVECAYKMYKRFPSNSIYVQQL